MNTLYYGDNLKILREYIKDESVDLIYLDPPFNSNRNYNVLFKDESGSEADSQITAFEDTWHWNATAEQTYHELILTGDAVARMIEAFRSFIGNNQMMAYLVMMAVRLKELHRVLKPTGSLYLHCDPTASHYLKILLDTTYGVQNFRNEITWKRTSSHSDAKKFARISDTILFYVKSNAATWNAPRLEYDDEYLDKYYAYTDARGRYTFADLTKPKGSVGYFYELLGCLPPPNGWRMPERRSKEWIKDGRIAIPPTGKTPRFKRYVDDLKGVVIGDNWTDLPPVNSQAKDALGYPTQKPIALLERIISASSNEGDLVLDPFCGCGTTIAAAQKLNRQWIGIDITHLSVGLQKLRLKDSFGLLPIGEKRSRRDQISIETEDETGQSSVGSAEDHSAPMERDKTDDRAVYKHSAPTEPEPANMFYRVIGQPEDIDGARELAANDRYGFQWWILPLIGAKAYGAEAGKKEGKKGADKGIDGSIVFVDDNSNKAKRVIVSVKSGKPSVNHIYELAHVIDRENAAIGVYVTLEPPTKPMITEAVGKGFYHSTGWNKDYPKLQILTVEEILAGKQVDMPPTGMTFKQAEKISKDSGQQPLEF